MAIDQKTLDRWKEEAVANGAYGPNAVYRDGQVWVKTWKHACSCEPVGFIDSGDRVVCNGCGIRALQGLTPYSYV